VEQLVVTDSAVRVSVTQIAARAGVSIATVSRVLNNTRRVNPEIAEQVRKAMTDLRYAPRPGRRKNRASATAAKRIAVVSLGGPYRDWFDMPVMASVVAEITRAAQADHLGVLMTEMTDPHKLSPILRQREIDGALVFIHGTLDSSAATFLAQQLPVVRVMGGQFAPVDIDHVSADHNAIGHLAASHLISRGARTLAYVTTRPDWDMNRLRAHGFTAAAQRSHAAAHAYVVSAGRTELSPICGPETRSYATLEELMEDLVARRPDGLFVSRDEETVQVYRLLAERGFQPGRDVQIVSCDNENVRLSMLHPRPASIEIGTAEMAWRAVRRLEGRMKHPSEPPVRILVNPRLVLLPEHRAE
jgi:DNA-binding LacI/PurR family transcriptional regulator